MEERMEQTKIKQLIRIVITGPESTGKTELCKKLAEYYNTTFIPEYAREYVQNLNRKYDYNDVIHIAKKQIEFENEYSKIARNVLFYDTYLIITKIWLEVVYKKSPAWIDHKLKNNNINLFLICAPDIPWIADGVRENGGEMRNLLFNRYIEELENYSCMYRIISGNDRFAMAKGYLWKILNI